MKKLGSLSEHSADHGFCRAGAGVGAVDGVRDVPEPDLSSSLGKGPCTVGPRPHVFGEFLTDEEMEGFETVGRTRQQRGTRPGYGPMPPLQANVRSQPSRPARRMHHLELTRARTVASIVVGTGGAGAGLRSESVPGRHESGREDDGLVDDGRDREVSLPNQFANAKTNPILHVHMPQSPSPSK
jgi:hypothetical protein